VTAGRIASAAALISVLTVASRLTGLLRVLVFNWSVGTTDLGDIYQAANTIPNIIFEIVAGGALASLVVPLLVAEGQHGGPGASETASALLTWVVTLLVPVAAVVALAARPLVRLLAPGASAVALDAGTLMLRIFAPQLPLYGVGIVLTAVLQTYRRFAWPVLAPLMSSVTVIGAYLGFEIVAGRGAAASSVGSTGLLVLSIGTTAGVAVLSLCLVVPLRRLRVGLRPRYRFAPRAAAVVRRLAAVGVATVAAQQLSLGLSIALAGKGPSGYVVLYGLAQTVFLLPWAVLALPIATSAYPALAEAGAAGDREEFAGRLAPAARSLLLLTCCGTAALIAVAWPGARLLAAVTSHPPDVSAFATAIIGFAPGLPGYGLFALLSRALYARGANRLSAAVTVLGWSAVALSSLVLSVLLPAASRVTALAAGNSVGMTVLGVALVVAVRCRFGAGCLTGLGRSAAVGIPAAALATTAGVVVSGLVVGSGTPTLAGAIGQGMLGGAIVVATFAATAGVADRRDTRPMLVVAARKLRRG
jgi:putative peptidoglycan lipid II flippase